MKSEKFVLALVLFEFILLATGIGVGYLHFKKYEEKITSISRENQLIRREVNTVTREMDDFKTSVKDLDNQLGNFAKEILKLSDKVNLSELEGKNIVAKIEDMEKNVEGWQKNYAAAFDAALSEFKKRMEILNNGDKPEESLSKKVDLGEVAVEKKE